MQIDVKGRNVPVTADLRAHVEKRFAMIGRQVSDLARLEVEFSKERNPAIADAYITDVTLYLKGVTLRARDCARDPVHALNLSFEELAPQVKRYRDKRRKRREARAAPVRGNFSPAL